MNRQMSFTEVEMAGHKKVTRLERFLSEMDTMIPWKTLVAIVEPHYPRSGERGRPPVGCERMLRMHLYQCWNNLSDEAAEDAIYNMPAVSNFIGMNLASEPAPDATTLLKFRHLLESKGLAKRFFDAVNTKLSEHGLLMRVGTIVDATIIAAPGSTKNQEGNRDPEMHQTKKGNQWHFGMKAHIGVDMESGLVHTVEATSANVADVSMTAKLLHGEEAYVYGDAGYTGAERREDVAAACSDVEWLVARKRGKVKAMPEGPAKESAIAEEYAKASVRSKVEHPFRFVKSLCGYAKVRYKGLAKNLSRLHLLFALSNIVSAAKKGCVLPNMA